MSRAMKVCSVSGCPVLVPRGRCDEHRRQADTARGTASQRGYSSTEHVRFRAAVLRRDPMCVLCKTARATVADHYPTSRRDLLEQRLDPNDPDRGRGLCASCHSKETATHQPGGWNVTT